MKQPIKWATFIHTEAETSKNLGSVAGGVGASPIVHWVYVVMCARRFQFPTIISWPTYSSLPSSQISGEGFSVFTTMGSGIPFSDPPTVNRFNGMTDPT